MSGWFWLFITFLGLIISAKLLVEMRKWSYGKTIFGSGRKQKVPVFIDNHYGNILMGYYFGIFIIFVFAVYFGFCKADIFSGLVAGTAITIFIIFELPQLMKPNIFVVYFPGIKATKTSRDEPEKCIKVQPGTEELLFFRLTNIGTNNYKKCTVWFFFPEGIMPIKQEEREDLYKDLDFRKDFDIQKQKRCAVFLPDENYQSISRGNFITFAIWVHVSKCMDISEKSENKVEFMASSESRWGTFKEKMQLEVTRGDGEGVG